MNNSLLVGIVPFSRKNAWRWRWRLATIAALVAVTITLYILFGAVLANMTVDGQARIQPYDVRAFDMLLVLPEDATAPAWEESRMIAHSEVAIMLKMGSEMGSLPMLGMQKNSAYFQSTAEAIQGSMPMQLGEIALPAYWAIARQLELGSTIELAVLSSGEPLSWQGTLVGIYPEDIPYPLALTTMETMRQWYEGYGNAHLLTCAPSYNLALLTPYISNMFPSALQISSYLPEMLGTSMLSQLMGPSSIMVVFIFLFMGVGVLTIALMTFLERRKELATLKAIGITNGQTVILFGLEYLLSGLGGLLFTLGLLTAIQKSPWSSVMASLDMNTSLRDGLAIAGVVLCLGLAYPILIAKVATVDQLQFGRTIPLRRTYLDRLDNPRGEHVYREQQENVRLLHIPFDSGQYYCMLLKSVGDPVKLGEIVAQQELYQGHVLNNTVSPCDGTVVEIAGALIIIKPTDPDAPRFPYPPLLAAEYQRSLANIARAREMERKLHEDEDRTR